MPIAKPGERFGGRQKGTPNKVTGDIRAALQEALRRAHKDGAVGYFKELAKSQPAVFCGLIGKIIPAAVELTGKDRGPIETADVTESARGIIAGRLAGIATRSDTEQDTRRLN